MTIKNQKLKLLYNHRNAVGHTERIDNTKKRIEGEGVLSVENKITKRIKNAAGNEFPYEMSLGMDARKIKLTYHPNGTTINGRTFNREMYVIKNTIVDEITICESGRDSNTSMRLLNSKFSKTTLKNLKNSRTTKTTKQSTRSTNPTNPATRSTNPTTKTRSTSSTKTRSQTPEGKINNTKGQSMKKKPGVSIGTALRLQNAYPEHTNFIARAVDKGWSKERILNTIKVRRLENQLPAPVKTGKRGQQDVKLMEARVLNAVMEHQDKEKIMIRRYGERMAERVLNMPMIGVKEWIVECARHMGEYSFNGHSDVQRLVNFVGRYNQGRIGNRLHNSGFSSFDMPNFFNRVTQITVEESWKLRGFFAKDMCYKTSQSNFNKTQRIRPAGGQMWEGLDQDGRIKHASFGEEQMYESSLDTKAQMVMFNRQIIKNDDFGMIRQLITLMLEGAEMVPDYKLVQRMLQKFGGFFTSYAADTETGGTGTGNEWRDAQAALSETSLKFAHRLASEQIIGKGRVNWINDIDDEWTIVVPTKAMEETAWELVEQPEFVSNTTANTKQGRKNYLYKKFKVRRFAQLANKTFNVNANKTNWFLWPSNPTYAPFAINWLDGIERPTVETVEAPVDMLGFGTRGWLDCDINDREPTSIVRMRPEAAAMDS